MIEGLIKVEKENADGLTEQDTAVSELLSGFWELTKAQKQWEGVR